MRGSSSALPGDSSLPAWAFSLRSMSSTTCSIGRLPARLPLRSNNGLQHPDAAASKPEPDLTTVRRSLEGTTSNRSRVETRRRKNVFSSQNLKVLGRVRAGLIANVDNERAPSPKRHPAMGSPNLTAAISSITTATFMSIATVTNVASCH